MGRLFLMAEAGGKIKDVQVAGTSVVENGIANVPMAGSNKLGTVMIDLGYGVGTNAQGKLYLYKAGESTIKVGTNNYQAIVPVTQHHSTFYGLSKAAGVDLANETVTLGTYPETSKTAIKAMLGVQDGLKVVRLI